MKIYKNLVQAVISALQKIFGEKNKADKTVEQCLISNKKWGSRDRKFVAHYIYESVRWYRLFYEVALDGNEPETESDWWKMLAAALVLESVELPDWPEFKYSDKDLILKKNSEIHLKRVVYASIPDWLDKLCIEELGEKKWTETIQALNQKAKTVLRVNTLKTTRAKLLDQFTRIGIPASEMGNENAIVLEEAKNLQQLQLFQEGLFEIQDYSSQQVVPFLNPPKGAIITDACAGAGGKSLHLAAHLGNRGFIKAFDIEENKLEELKKRAKRAGAQIISTQKINREIQVPEKYFNSTDYLLLDVPCSGLGVLRRNPDAKWKLNLNFLNEVKVKQRLLVSEYSKMLRPEGLMLYVTCSILPSENETQISWFLNESDAGKNFTFVKEKRIMPQDDGFDGFYMALLQKKS